MHFIYDMQDTLNGTSHGYNKQARNITILENKISFLLQERYLVLNHFLKE